MKKITLAFILIVLAANINAQDKLFTKNGKITFDATAAKSPENIDGINKTVICVLDTKTGDLQLSALMKGFEFERALMMEHFNENYVESNKFPKAIFKGTIINNATINYQKNDTYSVKVKGSLTMHGETKSIETDGKLIVKDGRIMLSATFSVLLSDYAIAIPQLVADKIAKNVKLIVDCTLDVLKK